MSEQPPSGRATAVQIPRPGTAELVPVEPLVPGPGEVVLRTLYSGVSAGTELTSYLGTNPYLHRRWDADRRLFADAAPQHDYPVRGFGYSEVGRVAGVGAGVERVRPGRLVWGIWGHRSDGLLPEAVAERQQLPDGADPLTGVFARVGAVALNAIIEADLHVGETVAIFGQGVIGLLATRLATLNGAQVVAVDARPERLEMATRFGAARTLDARQGAVAEAVRDATEGRGADACIELSGSYAALQEAIRTCGYNGRVVAAGFYQGDGGALRLGEEFHHNRVELVASQISGPPARYAHRWTRDRLHRDFMRLVTSGHIDPVPLVSHVLPAQRVDEAYRALTDETSGALQVVLDFRHEAGRDAS